LKGFLTGEFNFCITDVMMPIKDGYTLAKDIRKKDIHIPILFLTAKTLEMDKLKGFQVGGDDYLTKPFSMDELILRIHAIARRIHASPENNTPTIFEIGNVHFDYIKQKLYSDTVDLNLTAKECELLRLFCIKQNQVVERSEALLKVWHNDNYFNARSMDVYIAKIRKILKENSNVEIVNVHGVGFKMIVKKEDKDEIN
ncbi:MAG: response regulator transcription factor, partial [Bacteroidales bacterium]